MQKNTKAEQLAADQLLLGGIKTNLLSKTSMTVDGQDVLVTQMVSTVQSRIDAALAVPPTEAAFHAAVQKCDDVYASTDTFVSNLIAAIRLQSGKKNSTLLGTYGLAPAKSTKASARSLVVGAAKAKMTKASGGVKAAKAKTSAFVSAALAQAATASAAPEVATPEPTPAAGTTPAKS